MKARAGATERARKAIETTSVLNRLRSQFRQVELSLISTLIRGVCFDVFIGIGLFLFGCGRFYRCDINIADEMNGSCDP